MKTNYFGSDGAADSCTTTGFEADGTIVGVNAAVRILPCCTPAPDAALTAGCCIGCARYGAVVAACGVGGICGFGFATGTLNAVAEGCAT